MDDSSIWILKTLSSNKDSVQERNKRLSQVLNSPTNEGERWSSQWMMHQEVRKKSITRWNEFQRIRFLWAG